MPTLTSTAVKSAMAGYLGPCTQMHEVAQRDPNVGDGQEEEGVGDEADDVSTCYPLANVAATTIAIGITVTAMTITVAIAITAFAGGGRGHG